ncbi:MAG TPA: hypothetical protein PKM72_09485 [Nitrospirales bacterium]|nr:hypothetical protein [Nitrospirales bacterium]
MTLTHRMLYILFASVLLSWLIIPGVWGEESSRILTQQAMDACHEGRRAKDETARVAHFERGRELAKKSVELDENSADAHFALFCNIGERMRANGEVLFSVFEYGRMMEALDKTLLLNPNHMDALSSKGTILIEVPGLFGGDSEKGEAMLREVIQKDPEAINARMVVARLCVERGEDQEAFNLAKRALELARAANRDDLLPDAEKTFSEIQTKLASK